MTKNASPDPAQATQQKILLYVMPVMFALFGFGVPLGVLLYWTTTNIWSMGQQYYVIKKMPHIGPPAGTANGSGKNKPSTTKDTPSKPKTNPSPASPSDADSGSTDVVSSNGADPSAPPAPPAGQSRPPSAKARKKARARKGGRR